MNNLRIRSAAVAAVAFATVASGANAQSTGGSIQLLTQGESHTWHTGLDGSTEWTGSGYSFTGDAFGSGWGINWEMLANTAAAQSLVANYTVINTSSETQTFRMIFTDEVDVTYGAGSLVGGSVAGSYTDLNANGVTVSAIDGGSIYTAFVDDLSGEDDPFTGTPVGNLLTGASGSASLFQTGNFDASAFGDAPILPSQAIAGASTNYGFILEFTLSAGDTAAFTASMAIATPAPGAVAVFGVAGLTRRRRRSDD